MVLKTYRRSQPQAKSRLPGFPSPNFSKLQPTTLPLYIFSPPTLSSSLHPLLRSSSCTLVRLLHRFLSAGAFADSWPLPGLLSCHGFSLLLTARPLVWWVLSCLKHRHRQSRTRPNSNTAHHFFDCLLQVRRASTSASHTRPRPPLPPCFILPLRSAPRPSRSAPSVFANFSPLSH